MFADAVALDVQTDVWLVLCLAFISQACCGSMGHPSERMHDEEIKFHSQD